MAHFKVKATGIPKPTYQWQVSTGGSPFSAVGASTSALSVTATAADSGSLYRAVVSNPSGTVTTQPASLSIEPPGGGPKVKPLIVGLIDKGSEQPYHLAQLFPVTDTAEIGAYSPAFSGTVVNETWAQLEPTMGKWDFAPLDASLAAVSAYDSAHPGNPLGVKLRVWGGLTAPEWAKTLDGTPITVPPASSTDVTGTVGRFWSTDYEQQWAAFQTALAGRYDSNPLLREVAVTSCNTASAEPFVMDSTVITALLGAGWTSLDQQRCLEGALADFSAWQHTAVDFTFNPFTDVSASGVQTPDLPFASTIMSECAVSGIEGRLPQCILDNHGLTDSVLPRQTGLYAEIDALWQQYDHWVPVDFQTISPNGFNLCLALGIGIAYHAQSIEIWPPGPGFAGFDQYTPAQLTPWEDALLTGTQPSCT